jgi:hypothetical protein
MKILKIACLATIALLPSCSYKNHLNKFANGDQKTLQVAIDTKVQKIDFFTKTEGTRQSLGLIGALATINSLEGNGIIDISHAVDPANYIRKNLGNVLKAKYNLTLTSDLKKQGIDVNKHDVEYLLENYKEGDWVLDVYSGIYGYYYGGFGKTKYKVVYNAYANVIDRKTKSLIFKSRCEYKDEKDNSNYLDDIANNHKIITTIFSYAQDFCLEKFKKEIVQ